METAVNVPGSRNHADRLGIVTTTICLIHCLGSSILGLLAAANFTFIEDENFHIVFLAIASITVLGSSLKNKRTRRDFKLITVGLLGLVFLVAPFVLHFGHHETGHEDHLEEILTIVGGSFILFFHTCSFLKIKSAGLTCKDH